MDGSLTIFQIAGLILASLVAGAALLTLLLAKINAVCNPDMSDATGCGMIGMTLLVGALAFAVWVVSAA